MIQREESGIDWLTAGAACGLLGVALGAFGAHGLEKFATEKGLEWWSTATLYLMLHALALTGLGILARQQPVRSAPGTAFLSGIVLFSGTLYAMALGAPRWLGAITPLGGLALMLGWLLFAIEARRCARRSAQDRDSRNVEHRERD